jgi:dihydroorotate dehydrogenase
VYRLIRPLLFALDAERAHHATLALVRTMGRCAPARALVRSASCVRDPRLAVRAFGVDFANPVGLAAGYDKDGVATAGLAALGFGHVEIGTLTRTPQPGNPRPRVHRFPGQGALVNSLGFPNSGIDALRFEPRERLGGTRVGVNLGKSKDTPFEEAAGDYCALLERVHREADYVALNVSSPNTPGLRKLQERSAIEALLAAVIRTRDGLARRVPVLVKVAPDLSESELDGVLEAIAHTGVDGLIATNTTLSREGLPAAAAGLPGGTSGAPLRERALGMVRLASRRTGGRLPIIGVGGIASGEDALQRLRAGAHLVQLYTGLVYRGPGLVREIQRTLLSEAERAGLRTVAEWTGTA